MAAALDDDAVDRRPAARPGSRSTWLSRSVSTAIYYLLEGVGVSEMHRLPGDEVYHFYDGDPLEPGPFGIMQPAKRHPLVDPDGFIGPSYLRLPTILALWWALRGVVPWMWRGIWDAEQRIQAGYVPAELARAARASLSCLRLSCMPRPGG